MCGIAGIIRPDGGVNQQHIRRMTDSIHHRGPDGEGCFVNNDGTAGLGHRRLSIIDLSAAGSQPMVSGDKRYSIVFNGEIYNYIELRENLLKQGFRFSSRSDTEVLLTLYAQKGPKCLNELDGMFAFAIWDDVEKKLFCARDRFGEKPFYYHYVPGRHFLFASEIKAIRACDVHLTFHPHRLGWYFNDKYALSNPADQCETFYQEIAKLEAGHYLTVDRKLQLAKHKYWDISADKIDYLMTFEDATAEFKKIFTQSVGRRLRSDVPVGTSLSGGLDSSSVVCTIAELMKETGGIQNTFSARFKNYDKDEGDFIEEVVSGKAVHAYHTWPDVSSFLPNFQQFLYHQEEPVGSANQFSQWEVMKLAKANNVTVLLDGQGADEVITGYSHYFDNYFQELSLLHPEMLDAELGAYVQNINPSYSFSAAEKVKSKALFGQKTKTLLYPLYAKAIKPLLPVRDNPAGLLSPDYSLASIKKGGYPYPHSMQSLNQRLYHDAKEGKMEVLLRYGDKNSMAHSLEVRLPFLSHHLVEFLFSLPPWFKIHQGWSKYILRESLKDILPPKIAWRKDKIGYETPQEAWMKTKEFQQLLSDSVRLLETAGILNTKMDKAQLIRREWQIINIAALMNAFKL